MIPDEGDEEDDGADDGIIVLGSRVFDPEFESLFFNLCIRNCDLEMILGNLLLCKFLKFGKNDVVLDERHQLSEVQDCCPIGFDDLLQLTGVEQRVFHRKLQ